MEEGVEVLTEDEEVLMDAWGQISHRQLTPEELLALESNQHLFSRSAHPGGAPGTREESTSLLQVS